MQVPFRYLSIASSFEPCQGKGPCTSDRLWNPISSGATWVNFHDHDVGPWKQMDSAPSVINRSTCTFAHLAPRAHAQAIRDSRLTYKEKRFRKPGGGCIDFIQYLKVNLELVPSFEATYSGRPIIAKRRCSTNAHLTRRFTSRERQGMYNSTVAPCYLPQTV